jgi:predicted ATP-grasp superfamily ATP-dependent carboligase
MRVDLLIPITDETILPIATNRARFEETTVLAIPDAQAHAVAGDKFETAELARSLGVPVPRSCLVTSAAEATRSAQALGWPVVLKPRRSRSYRPGSSIESFGVTYANSPEEVERRMQSLEGRCDVLVQEYYPGAGHGVELLLWKGRPLAAFQHKRLREIPIYGGASAFRESVPLDPQLYADSVRLLEVLGWTGLAMVEFKIGANGPRLMEINGRVWGSMPLALHAGVDFPALLADLLVKGPPPATAEPLTNYRVGVRSRNLELDLMWIFSTLLGRRRYPFLAGVRRRDAIGALFGLINPLNRFDILSLGDPGPGMAEIMKIASKFRGKMAEPAAAPAR